VHLFIFANNTYSSYNRDGFETMAHLDPTKRFDQVPRASAGPVQNIDGNVGNNWFSNFDFGNNKQELFVDEGEEGEQLLNHKSHPNRQQGPKIVTLAEDSSDDESFVDAATDDTEQAKF
jgi:hypothetical protein